jgi:hypothetical protein
MEFELTAIHLGGERRCRVPRGRERGDQKRFDREQRRETVGYAIKKYEREEEDSRLRKMPRVKGMEDLKLKMCALHETTE